MAGQSRGHVIDKIRNHKHQYPRIERYLGTNIVVHAGVNGEMTTGWYQDPQSKNWYYFAKNGFGYDRVHYIGGKKYNFFKW